MAVAVLCQQTKPIQGQHWSQEGVYVTIGNAAFCLFLYLTGVHFRDELQHVGDVSQQKIKWRQIRTREIGGASLSGLLNVKSDSYLFKVKN